MARGERDRDREVIDALALGFSHSEAAKVSGVSNSTIARRLRSPEFISRVEARRTALRSDFAAEATGHARSAMRYLARVVNGQETAPVTVRVRAAATLLADQSRRTEQAEVERRLADVEEVLGVG